MKCRLFLSVLVLLLFSPVMARRVMWGVQAGWDTRRMALKSDFFEVDNHSGWFIGPQASLQFPRAHLALEASLLYNQRRMDFKENETGTLHGNRLSYLVVPVSLRYTFRIGKPLGIFLSTGPQWRRYLSRGHHIHLNDDMDLRLDPGTLSWNVGVGVEFFRHLFVGFTYNFGIDDECWKSSLSQSIRDFDVKKNSCQVSLTCLF